MCKEAFKFEFTFYLIFLEKRIFATKLPKKHTSRAEIFAKFATFLRKCFVVTKDFLAF
jgi:hypothetical protein